MDNEFVGTRNITDVAGILGADGQWRVTVLITQKRTKDGKEWESKELSVTDVNKEFNMALLSCNFTVQTYLKSVDYNLFNEMEDDKVNDIKN